jgi:hypothetical protein
VFLQLLCQEYRQHCLALTRTTQDPKQALRVAIAIAIAIANAIVIQPGVIVCILSNPFAGTIDPLAFGADQARTIDVGISEKEGVAALLF